MTPEEIKKVKEKRRTKIKNCIGVIEGYHWLKKNKQIGIKQNISKHQYRRIIRECNKDFIETLLNKGIVSIPYGLGKLLVRKEKCCITYDNNVLKTNLRIDWGKTVELWSLDEEAKRKKTLVRYEQKYNYFIIYTKKDSANFKNRIYYKLRIFRSVQKRMRDKLSNNELDAFLI